MSQSADPELLAASSLFDGPWYLARNPDVAAAAMDPALHYLEYGAFEGRDPGPHFSSAAYLAANPDVRQSGLNPLLHYLTYGAAEGRAIPLSAAAAATHRTKVLYLDDHIPYPELGVGYPRARNLIRELVALECFVTFVPLECPNDDGRRLRSVIPSEVEVMLGVSPSALASFLAARAGRHDVILASRPNNMRTLLTALDQLPSEHRRVPILYDAEALWTRRETLRLAVEGTPLSNEEQERRLEKEIHLARAASHVTAVSEQEAAIFKAHGCRSVSVLGQGYALSATPMAHAERHDLLFVGALTGPSPCNAARRVLSDVPCEPGRGAAPRSTRRAPATS